MPTVKRDGPLDVPSRTVTFLFTDIEVSTRLLGQLREGRADVLADQRDLLWAALVQRNDVEIDTQDEAFFVSLPCTGCGGGRHQRRARHLAGRPGQPAVQAAVGAELI